MPDNVTRISDKDRLFRQEQDRLRGVTEEMTAIDRAIIGGGSVRLEIPLTSTDDLRCLPELVRGWATFIDFTRGRKELSEREKLSMVASETRALRMRIREITGAGKFNRNGTVKRG